MKPTPQTTPQPKPSKKRWQKHRRNTHEHTI
jgi:hypothetical protein